MDLISNKIGLVFTFVSSDKRYNQIKDLCVSQIENVEFSNSSDGFIGLTNLNSKGADRNGDEIAENSLVITDNQLLLEVINYPDPNLDWVGALKQYQENYRNPLSSEDTLFMWGQKSQAHHETMCSNCGYILEVLEDGTYPICPACQAGAPDSPSAPDNPFWKNLT